MDDDYGTDSGIDTGTDYSVSDVAVVGRCEIMGKVDSRRFFKDKYYTTLLVPAADEYSQPSVVEVRSNTKIAEVGEVVSRLSCVVSGYFGKTYTFKDKESGESVTRKPINHVLDAVEF